MVWTAGAALTAAQMNTYLPQAWASYTPTVVNGSSGTTGSSVTGKYIQYGKTVHFRAKVVFGTGFTMSASVGLSLPVAPVAGAQPNLVVNYLDAGSNTYTATGLLSGSNVVTNVVGTNGAGVTTSYTVPFTWAAGDAIEISGTYEAA